MYPSKLLCCTELEMLNISIVSNSGWLVIQSISQNHKIGCAWADRAREWVLVQENRIGVNANNYCQMDAAN